MNGKAAAAIAGISAVIIIGVVFALTSQSPSPDVQEEPVVEEQEYQFSQQDSVATNDSAMVDKSTDFIIDEEGNKKYIISAEDNPTIGK